jgi:hypothetical protein
MPLSSLLIEFPSAPLALNPIVHLRRHVLRWIEIRGASFIFFISCSHCLTEHHWLQLPFWNFATGFGGGFSLLFRLVRFVVFVFRLYLVNSFSFPHLLCIKRLSFLINFIANFLMLNESRLSKITATRLTRHSGTIILFLGIRGREWICLHRCLLVDTQATLRCLLSHSCWLIYIVSLHPLFWLNLHWWRTSSLLLARRRFVFILWSVIRIPAIVAKISTSIRRALLWFIRWLRLTPNVRLESLSVVSICWGASWGAICTSR